jgi:glutaredoxin
MEFIVYSKEGCPYCVNVKQVLELSKLNFKVLSLDENFTREEFYEKFGHGTTFPQVIMDGKNLGGCIDTIKYLKENSIV